VGRRTDGGDDALTDAGEDRLLARAADEPVDVRAHGHAGERLQFDPVLGDARDHRGLDDLGVHRHANGFQRVTPGKVDGRGLLEGQGDLRAVGGDQRLHHPLDVPASQVVRLQLVRRDVDAGLDRCDQRQDDLLLRHFAQAHPDQREGSHARNPGGDGRDPKADREELQHDHEADHDDDGEGDDGSVHQKPPYRTP
jgi:hypothetical protein